MIKDNKFLLRFNMFNEEFNALRLYQKYIMLIMCHELNQAFQIQQIYCYRSSLENQSNQSIRPRVGVYRLTVPIPYIHLV